LNDLASGCCSRKDLARPAAVPGSRWSPACTVGCLPFYCYDLAWETSEAWLRIPGASVELDSCLTSSSSVDSLLGKSSASCSKERQLYFYCYAPGTTSSQYFVKVGCRHSHTATAHFHNWHCYSPCCGSACSRHPEGCCLARSSCSFAGSVGGLL